MCRKTSAILVVLALAGFSAKGQTPASLEMEKTGAVWFNSSNAAGITVTSPAPFEAVGVTYDIADGNYRRQTDGNVKTLGVDAEGASSLGKGKVWGKFSYSNITERDTKYNTMSLNLDEDNPFFVADDQPSWWKKQRYELSMKGATPLYRDRFAFGVSAGYFTESGAKQIDPRGYGSEYGVEVKPAAILKLDRSFLGLALDYENGNMRMTPINNAYMNSKAAWIMHGLGNSEVSVISLLADGVGQVFDRKNQFGASLQYGIFADGVRFLADIYGSMRIWDISHTPSRPQRIGTTNRTEAGAKFQLVSDGGDCLGVLVADASMKSTKGIEYIQVFNRDYNVQAYETVGKNVKSKYSHTEARLGYDIYRKNDTGFNWTAGCLCSWYGRDDIYLIPESTFSCGNLYAEAHGRKQFSLKGVSLVTGALAGYSRSFGAQYDYQGSGASTPIVTDYFPSEAAYRATNWLSAGLNINVSFAVSQKTDMYFGAGAKLIKTDNNLLDRRSLATFSAGFIF